MNFLGAEIQKQDLFDDNELRFEEVQILVDSFDFDFLYQFFDSCVSELFG